MKNKKGKYLLQMALALLAGGFISTGMSYAQVVSGAPQTSVLTTPISGPYNRYEVTTGPAQTFTSSSGKILKINAFSQFDLAGTGPLAQDEAYILLQGANASINIVNNIAGANINGLLRSVNNAYTDPSQGGMIFIAPGGIAIGTNGWVDAGSVLLSTANNVYLPLGPGTYTEANLMDPAQWPRLIQGYNDSGVIRMADPLTPIIHDGQITSTSQSNFLGDRYGVFMFANWLSILGYTQTLEGGTVGEFTGYELDYNLSTSEYLSVSPLVGGGQIWQQGIIDAPGGTVAISADTVDLLGNIINISGTISANAATSGADGGLILINTVQTGGLVDIVSGTIQADGLDAGGGGTIILATNYTSWDPGSLLCVKNGATSTQGGTIVMDLSTYPGPIDFQLGGAGYLDVADPLVPGATGNFVVQTSGSQDIRIIGNPVGSPISFPALANVSFLTQCGNIFVENGTELSPNTVFGDLRLVGDEITVNGAFQSYDGDILLASRSGIINIAPGAFLEAEYGNIIFSRSSSYLVNTAGDLVTTTAGTTGALNVTSDGKLMAGWDGANSVIVGNYTDPYAGASNYTNEVNLTGTTWGTHAGKYVNATAIALDPAGNPMLVASNLDIRVTPTPAPAPQPSPISPTLEAAIEIVQPALNDLDNYFTNWEYYDLIQSKANDILNPQSEIIVEGDGMDLGGTLSEDSFFDNLDLSGSFSYCSGSSCDEYTKDSVGDAVVDVLSHGYPAEMEYFADQGGVDFSFDSNYNPTGLLKFLETLKVLENDKNKIGGGSENSLFAYKHPPTDFRIDKVNTELDSFHVKDFSDKKVNQNRFNKVIDEVEE